MHVARRLKVNYKSVWGFVSGTYTQTIHLRRCKCSQRVNQDKPWESDFPRTIFKIFVCTFAIRFCFSGSKNFESLWMPALFTTSLCIQCAKASILHWSRWLSSNTFSLRLALVPFYEVLNNFRSAVFLWKITITSIWFANDELIRQ